MLLFPIRNTTFFPFPPEEQSKWLDANLKINILYLDRYIDDSFQEHQSQYCWELSPDLFQPKKKKRQSIIFRESMWAYFSHLGTQKSTPVHSLGNVKNNSLSVICLRARVCFSNRRPVALAFCKDVQSQHARTLIKYS